MSYLKCRDCVPPERHPGCHGTCVYFIEWNKKHQEELEKIRKGKWMDRLSRPQSKKRK